MKDRKTGLALTVSTIRIARGHYDTVVFDDSTDKRHSGMILAGHEHEGRQYGPYVIDATRFRADTRDEAMDQHREALYAARTEEPWPPRGGHDATCAYVSGMTSRCTCSEDGAS
ncbi:hypothetical protein ACWGMA_08520 [Streptomyces asiaticus]